METSTTPASSARYSAIFVFCIAFGALLWRAPLLLAFSYLAISVVLLCRWRSQVYVLQFLISLLAGSLAEAVGTGLGVWRYPGSTFFPIWLPVAWGLAGILTRQVADGLRGRTRPQSPNVAASRGAA